MSRKGKDNSHENKQAGIELNKLKFSLVRIVDEVKVGVIDGAHH